MRVSTYQFQNNALRMFAERQREIGFAQQQIATGERIQQSSDDPLGAARTARLDGAISQYNRYQSSIDAASTDIVIQDEALGDLVNLLQRVQETIVEAQNGTRTSTDHANLATELRSIQKQVLAVANTTNGAGEYLFAGTRTGQPAFVNDLGSVRYQGTQVARELNISISLKIEATSSGSDVFESITSGNGRFAVGAASTNTGTALASQANIVDSSALVGSSYRIEFTSSSTFDVVDETTSTTVLLNQAYTEDSAFSFDGIELSISGIPATGDVYNVQPSTRKSVFELLEEVAGALERGTGTDSGYALLGQSLQSGLAEVTGALERIGAIRTGLGSSLVSLDVQQEYHASAILGFQEARSEVASLDYPEAISRLSNSLQVLESAQQSFISTQNLSLFRILR